MVVRVPFLVFVHAGEYEARDVSPQRSGAQGLTWIQVQDQDPTKAYGTALCPICGAPSLILCSAQRRYFQNILTVIDRPDALHGGGDLIELADIFPGPAEAVVDRHWPPEMHELFRDAQNLLTEGRSASLIIAACRSVLDVSRNRLQAKGADLKQRIDDLRTRSPITDGIAAWSHELRLAGTEAVHEIGGKASDAQALVEFMRQFLDVAFSLPARIDARRHASAS